MTFAKTAKIGDPMASDTQVGPVTTPPQFKKVLDYIDIGKAEGATLASRSVRGEEPAVLYIRALARLLEPLDCAQPQHANRPRIALHALGNLVERQSLQVAHDDHVAIMGLERRQLVGELHGAFALPQRGAR